MNHFLWREAWWDGHGYDARCDMALFLFFLITARGTDQSLTKDKKKKLLTHCSHQLRENLPRRNDLTHRETYLTESGESF